jgi:hypothetical protein
MKITIINFLYVMNLNKEKRLKEVDINLNLKNWTRIVLRLSNEKTNYQCIYFMAGYIMNLPPVGLHAYVR